LNGVRLMEDAAFKSLHTGRETKVWINLSTRFFGNFSINIDKIIILFSINRINVTKLKCIIW
jgi:hypothetical protein